MVKKNFLVLIGILILLSMGVYAINENNVLHSADEILVSFISGQERFTMTLQEMIDNNYLKDGVAFPNSDGT